MRVGNRRQLTELVGLPVLQLSARPTEGGLARGYVANPPPAHARADDRGVRGPGSRQP